MIKMNFNIVMKEMMIFAIRAALQIILINLIIYIIVYQKIPNVMDIIEKTEAISQYITYPKIKYVKYVQMIKHIIYQLEDKKHIHVKV